MPLSKLKLDRAASIYKRKIDRRPPAPPSSQSIPIPNSELRSILCLDKEQDAELNKYIAWRLKYYNLVHELWVLDINQPIDEDEIWGNSVIRAMVKNVKYMLVPKVKRDEGFKITEEVEIERCIRQKMCNKALKFREKKRGKDGKGKEVAKVTGADKDKNERKNADSADSALDARNQINPRLRTDRQEIEHIPSRGRRRVQAESPPAQVAPPSSTALVEIMDSIKARGGDLLVKLAPMYGLSGDDVNYSSLFNRMLDEKKRESKRSSGKRK